MLSRFSQPEILDLGCAPGQELQRCVYQALGTEGATLHELDYEDLALSAAAMRLVRQAATAVLRRFCASEELPLSRALALFLDHVFWDEKSGGLILCADFPGQSFCLPIPRDWWGLRPRLEPVQ